jgi:surface protein
LFEHRLIVIMEERLLPLAKRAKTTQDEGSTTDMTTGAAAAAKNDHTIMDLLRSLPASVVANYIYPFAVKVIQNREAMIAAVDEYLDEFYSNGDGDDDDDIFAEFWSDQEHGEDTVSDDNEEAEKQDVSSTVSDDRISSGPRHQNSNLEPRGKSDEPQDKKETAVAPVHSSRIHYPIGEWDVSRVDDFTSVLDKKRNRKARRFNEDLSRWNVANGTSFARMFFGCYFFQSDLTNWHTGRATDFSGMFHGCTSFHSDVSKWNVGNATDLSYMFYECTIFNSDLSRWNVAHATDLSGMFLGCGSFQRENVATWSLPN